MKYSEFLERKKLHEIIKIERANNERLQKQIYLKEQFLLAQSNYITAIQDYISKVIKP